MILKMLRFNLFPFILINIMSLTSGIPDSDEEVRKQCSQWKTCGECIISAANCYWCSDAGYSGDRCNLRPKLLADGCTSIGSDGQDGKVIYTQNESTRNANGSRPAIQLSPQVVTLRPRPHQPLTVPVMFRQAENFPVDLYFLMDGSNTMEEHKKTLVNITERLALKLKNITADYRLGFGTFIDKRTLPYTDVSVKYEGKYNATLVPGYGFKNQLSLTHSTDEFKNKVNSTMLSGNLDSPEGGLDAIIQVLACENVIGWRNHARKLLLYVSDADFHYAGDGKLAGIVSPNDGSCHLDAAGYYTESLNQDYPSISQIINNIVDRKVNIIFAVPNKVFDLYSVLSSYIDGSAIGKLPEIIKDQITDQSVLERIVQENYSKISTSIKLSNEVDPDVMVTYSTTCGGTITSDTPECLNISIGKNVTINVTLEVKSCPKDEAARKKQIKIIPTGLTELLVINVEIMCECGCEKTSRAQSVKSNSCSDNGRLACGVCVCDRGYFGDQCECGNPTFDVTNIDAKCKKSTLICEGRGQCICGQCNCTSIPGLGPDKRYTGDHCECNDYSCEDYNGQPCGGSQRGTCNCGQCKCAHGFNGTNCGCETSEQNCRDRNKNICGGRGECKCGQCFCHEPSRYGGPTCEQCSTCQDDCQRLKPCVLCKFYPDEICTVDCPHLLFEWDNSIEDEIRMGWDKCNFTDERDSCEIIFVFDETKSKVKAQEKTCEIPLSNAVIIGLVVGLIILLAVILLIIWKAIVTLYDKREYERFQTDIGNTQWKLAAPNPIYKDAVSTYQNPTFAANRMSMR